MGITSWRRRGQAEASSILVNEGDHLHCFQTHLQHQTVHLDVHVLVGLLGVVQLVDFHELLQTLPEVEGEEVEPDQAARIQYELQGIQLDVEVGAGDWSRRAEGQNERLYLNNAGLRGKFLTGILFSIREVILRELYVNGRHLRRKVQGFLIARDHRFWTGATLVRCRHLQHTAAALVGGDPKVARRPILDGPPTI